MEDDPEDRIHHFLRTDTPAMDEMDARMEAHGIPRLLMATGVDGGLPPNPTTPVQAGVPPDLAIRVKDGVPLSQEVAGDNPKW